MNEHAEGEAPRERQQPMNHSQAQGHEGDAPSRPRPPGAGNPGNFANNRAKAVEAGRRGGQHSHGGGGAGNNPGNFANNRQRAAEAGRKGGMQPRREGAGREL
jgi:general stress protein YciG